MLESLARPFNSNFSDRNNFLFLNLLKMKILRLLFAHFYIRLLKKFQKLLFHSINNYY